MNKFTAFTLAYLLAAGALSAAEPFDRLASFRPAFKAAQEKDSRSLVCDIEYRSHDLSYYKLVRSQAPLKESAGANPEATTWAAAEDENLRLDGEYTSNVWVGPADGAVKPSGLDRLDIQLTFKATGLKMHLPGYLRQAPRFRVVLEGGAFRPVDGADLDHDRKPVRFVPEQTILRCEAAFIR